MTTPRKIVLCIDDEESGLTLRKLLLESRGFNVLMASGGDEALAILGTRTVDAVILDYQLPDMDGAVVSAHIKALSPRTPVIMLTAHASAAEIVSESVDAFMEKAQDPDLLISRLESLVRLRSHSHPELESEYVVFADALRHYLDCSDGVCQLLGYPRMELINMTIEDVSYRSARVSALFEQYKKQGKMDGQYVLLSKSGQPVFITYRAHAFDDGCLAAVWEPIKDWKQIYQTAMLEFDGHEIEDKLDAAQVAIEQRKRELSAAATHHPEEWQEIEDALSGLRVLSRDIPQRPLRRA